jgi:plastocyanin
VTVSRCGRRSSTIALLAAALVVFAACGGGGSSTAYKEPKGPAVAQLTFDAKNFAFTPSKATAPAGIVGITLQSTEGGHDFVIDGLPGFKLTVTGSGSKDSGKVDLKKGKYTFYCSLPGHRAAGMQGTITVS